MATGSVLYVTESPEVDEAAFATAQEYALAQELPFTVVYCLELEDPERQLKRIGEFHPLETFLQPYTIPLMILIGKRDKVLPWMSGHVKPVRIFTPSDRAGEGMLRNHPINWPGRVMTVAELEALVSGDQTYCLPR
jgi:hypothetical protein